jgi:hypothetical protein
MFKSVSRNKVEYPIENVTCMFHWNPVFSYEIVIFIVKLSLYWASLCWFSPLTIFNSIDFTKHQKFLDTNSTDPLEFLKW